MSYITNKAGITLDGGFKLDSAQPLDVRFVVEKDDDRDDLLTSSCYPGMEVWDYNDNKKYIAKYDGTNYSWVEVTSVETSTTNGNIKINGEEKKVYEHPTTNGNKHIPADGAKNNILRYDSAGSAKWEDIAYTSTPKGNGVASAGSANTFSRGDHIHPAQTTITGNAGTATKFNSSRTIQLTGDITGSATTDGSSGWSITTTIANKGVANGVATLDENGHVPSTQLPSYVDDVIEGYISDDKTTFYEDKEQTEKVAALTGKIYVDLNSLRTYRWGGTTYAEISESLALGETSSTAYAGDKGAIAYTHSQKTSGNPHGVTKSDVGLGNVPNVTTNDQTPTFSQASTLTNIASGEKTSTIFGKIMKAIADFISHLANRDNPHGVTQAQIGLENVENKSSATIRGELTKDNVVKALGYTPPKQDTQVTVDSALSADSTNPVQNKIIKAALDGKVGVITGKGLSTNDLTNNLKENYDKAYTHSTTTHAPANAEPNQNAFSNIAVSGQTTIQADAKTDTLTLVAGNNILITTDATADEITINAEVKTTARTSTTHYFLTGTTGATTEELAYDTGIKMGDSNGELIMKMCNVNSSEIPAGMVYDSDQKALRFIIN